MKNQLSFRLLSRWVFMPLLLGSLFAWSVSPAYSGNSPTAPTSLPAPAKAASENNADVQEIKVRIQELEARERQNYALVLEGQRKTMDWWFSFLAVLTALMAIFGALIPFLMARKDKEMIEHDKDQIRKLLEEVKGMKAEAEDGVGKIHQHEVDAEKLLKGFQSGKQSDESDSKISAAVATIEQDKNADIPLRLRAEAIAASQANDATKAYALWNALATLEPNDAISQFNAGYWAQKLGMGEQGVEKLQWLKLAGKHYSNALSLKPDLDGAANNWGNALAAEASVLLSQEISSARVLWQQAGEKYQQALTIKPDKHEAANNWGWGLAAEANAISAQDLPGARSLWKLAGEKFRQALGIKSDCHEAANNWGVALLHEASAIATIDAGESEGLLGQAEWLLLAHADASPGEVAYNLACVYGLRGDVQSCLQWLKVCQSHNKLPDCTHLRNDKDLNAVREAPEFVAWLATVCKDQNTQDTSEDQST